VTSPPAATILIVDDEIQNRKLLEALLRPEGYVTFSASTGQEALASVALRAPDLILLDVMMPGMDGYETASRLKANPATSNIPIIMVTAQIDRGARLAGLNAGAEEFLTKPVERAELWLRVRNLLRLKALGDFFQSHSLILEQQVQARTQSLHASELRFRQMAESINDIFFLVDAESNRTIYVSPAYEEIFGRSCESLYANPDSWSEMIHPDDREVTSKTYKKGLSVGTFEYEYRIIRSDQSIRWVHTRGFPVRDDAGKIVRIAGVGRDVTEPKKAEDRIRRLNRLYAVLSGINTLIVRVRDRNELFREACRIAVELGAFRMAWIGVIDPQTLDGKIVAWHGGGEDDLHEVRLTARDGTPDSEQPACRALRQSRAMICNDIAMDPSVAPFRDDLLRRGHKSVGCFPLMLAGRPAAVITLFAGESGVFDEEEVRLLLELAGDISFAMDHIETAQKIDYLAYYDALTGLANRNLFLDRVAQYMRSAVSSGHKLALGLIDLERFKNINDSLGQSAGDMLLRQVAEWLTHNFGDVNLLARVGADHFAVVLPEVKHGGEAARRLQKAMEAFLDHPFHLNDAVFRIAAKIGVALFPDDAANADILFKNAEAALKKAKASGERYLFYTQKMTNAVAGRLTLENQLRQALDNGEFVLHYQPKVSLVSGKITGAEALIRWNDPRTGLVPPGHFIPILEETGLIHEVGRWALRKAIDDYLHWRATGLAAVRIAVNVSSLQLRNRGFLAEIEQAIGIDSQAAAGLELEITESLIMEDVRSSITSLQAIRALGINIAIDDFGTGFSSLSYLSKLPVDTIKIDRSFVIDMTTGPEGLSLVSTIINLAHSLRLKVVAEGVETEEQSRLLRLLGCDEMQGYLFGKAVSREIFETVYLVMPIAGESVHLPKSMDYCPGGAKQLYLTAKPDQRHQSR